MTPETRKALRRTFLRALHPDAKPEPALITPADSEREVAELHAELQAMVEARLRQIPASIGDQLMFAARQGPKAVRTLLTTAFDDALRELAEQGGDDTTEESCVH